MLSKSRYTTANNIGVIIAYDVFVMMLNPKYRGEEFTWDKLECIVTRLVAANLALGNWGRDRKGMEDAAINTAGYTVRKILADSGVLEWLPLRKDNDKKEPAR